MMDPKKYEDKMLALPIAGKVSGEDVEHQPGDTDYNPIPDSGAVRGYNICGCDRCRIIRIKRRKAFRFPKTRCAGCGELHYATLLGRCPKCGKENCGVP